MSPLAIIKHGTVLPDGWANGDWLLFYWGLTLLWVLGMTFENTCTVSGEQNEDVGSVQDFSFAFTFGVNQENWEAGWVQDSLV